jgi:hypothetical protein
LFRIKGLFGFTLAPATPNHGRANILAKDSLAPVLPARGRKIRSGYQFFGVASLIWLQSKRQGVAVVNAKFLVWQPSATIQTGPKKL